MPGGKRLWRTADGDLVEEGHPDARLLAYGIDDDLDPKDLDNIRPAGQDDPEPEDDKDDDQVEIPEDLTTVEQLVDWVIEPESEDEMRDRAKAVLEVELSKDEDDRRVTLVDPLTELLTAEKVERPGEPEKVEKAATPKATGRPSRRK